MMTPAARPVRVRFAPSPTGNLHIGGVRSALFNFLFARKEKGSVLLRIEDTDEARSTPEYEKDIRESFEWLGLHFDEGIMPDGSAKGDHGPYRQTERLDLYEKALRTLLSEHKAYYCFCGKEELEAQRQSQEAAGLPQIYSGKCRSLAVPEATARVSAGEPAVIRLKVAAGKKEFTDLIRGDVAFDNSLIGDIVIAKGLREPLYNFAVVIDDDTMQISHVIRGEEHLANTPKQLLIAEALGVRSPSFAHLPIILSATGKGKMSKRDGGTSVREYRDAGYLPEAMINFLALLGWHPTGDNEILSFDQMVEAFSLDRVQKGGARFDKEKLDHFNQYYLKQLSADAFLQAVRQGSFAPSAWGDELLKRALPVVRDRMTKLSELQSLAGFFFVLPEYEPTLLVWKKSDASAAAANLERCHELLLGLPDQLFELASLEAKFIPLAEQYGKGDVFWPLRVALSGQEASPPPVAIVSVLGKTESLRRIRLALDKLASLS